MQIIKQNGFKEIGIVDGGNLNLIKGAFLIDHLKFRSIYSLKTSCYTKYYNLNVIYLLSLSCFLQQCIKKSCKLVPTTQVLACILYYRISSYQCFVVIPFSFSFKKKFTSYFCQSMLCLIENMRKKFPQYQKFENDNLTL